MVLVKNWQFFHLCIIGKIGQENVFENILKKKAFQDYKNKKLKKSKNWDFSTILVKNWQFFCLFIIDKIGQKNVFENILERKKAFPDYKKQEVKVGTRRGSINLTQLFIVFATEERELP